MNDFPCTSCGECCRHVQSRLTQTYDDPILNDLMNRFPYKAREDGSCEMLTDDGLCSVYDHRPLVCNVKLGALLLGLYNDDWVQMQADACNEMIKKANLDDKFKVVL